MGDSEQQPQQSSTLESLLKGFVDDKSALQTKDLRTSTALTTYADGNNTATRHLGMEIELNNYNNSMMALTNPRRYAELRALAFTEMGKKIDATFKAIYDELTGLGMSHEQAKAEAMEGAAREKHILERGFYLKFPQDANAIANKEHVKAASSEYLGASGVQSGHRAAPARRKKRK